MYNTNYNIFLQERKNVVEILTSTDNSILENANASKFGNRVRSNVNYNHQMKPSMTLTRPTLMPAICLLGLAMPVWLAEAAAPVLLPVADPEREPVLRLPLPVWVPLAPEVGAAELEPWAL
jgi:hypothetical protein